MWAVDGEESQPFRIHFWSTAGESVLVESWIYEGETYSLTTYHLDGDELLCRHYCPLGNQPRLRRVAPREDGAIRFALLDAAGLSDPMANHQTESAFLIWASGDRMTRSYTYTEGGVGEETVLELRRVDAGD